ncbi:MAG: TadE/TadG family type IV pilus assembly protein [Terracidiphilus sp.]
MKTQTEFHGKAKALKRSLNRAQKPAKSRSGPRGPRFLILLHASERGSALVEMALVLPMLMVLITGVCAFGMAFNNQLTLTSAVSAGTQYLQLIRTSTTNPCADTLSAIEGSAPGINGTNISLTFKLNGTTVSGSSCAGDQTYLVQGTPVTVTATYPCNLPIYGMKFTNTCQLSAKVTEYEY